MFPGPVESETDPEYVPLSVGVRAAPVVDDGAVGEVEPPEPPQPATIIVAMTRRMALWMISDVLPGGVAPHRAPKAAVFLDDRGAPGNAPLDYASEAARASGN